MDHIFFVTEMRERNPFSSDGKYDSNWVQLTIDDDAEYHVMTGTTIVYGLKVSKLCEGWPFRVMDFIEYHTSLGKNILCTGNRADFEIAKSLYAGHSPYDKNLREYEPDILVHSTTIDGYTHIVKDGEIKSWNKVKEENKTGETQPIGSALGDPVDFRDYVMLGNLGHWTELVVNSKQKGAICMDADSEYTPGARFYFETKQLLRDGLLIRDGAHMKVKDALPLRYCGFVATAGDVQIKGPITPKSFAEAADEALKRQRRRRSSFCRRDSFTALQRECHTKE